MAREELLRRDATAAARSALEDKEIRAAGAGGGALQGLGGQESRPQQAQERRRDAHRAHRGRTHPDLCRARAPAGAGDGDIDARVALRLPTSTSRRPTARKLHRHRAADDRRRRPHRGAGRQRRRQVDAAVGARRRLRPGTASTTTARRGSASIRPAGWSISTRPCATCRSETAILDYVAEAEGVTEKEAIRLLAPRPASPSPASASRSACSATASARGWCS